MPILLNSPTLNIQLDLNLSVTYIGGMDFFAHMKSVRGEQSRLAHAMGIQPSAISQWDRVPVERVLDVERLTGISRHDLRPDIYGPSALQNEAAE